MVAKHNAHSSFRLLGLLLLSLCLVVSCFYSRPAARTTPYRIVRGSIPTEYGSFSMEKKIQGFSDDFLLTMSQMYNIKLQIETMQGALSLRLLENKDVDAVLTFVSPNFLNIRDYLFSEPFFIEGPVIVSRIGESYDSLKSIGERLVGIDRGYLWTLQQNESLECIFQAYDSDTEMIEALVAGKIDAIILNSVVASSLVQGLYGNKIHVTSSPLLIRGFRLVVKKGRNEELIQYLNEGLKSIVEKGTYGRMLRYWGLFNAKEPL